jgi:hypothetical protein
MIRFIILSLLFIDAGAARSQTTVTTQDEIVFRGRIIRKGFDSLTIMTLDSQVVTLPNVQVRSIAEEEERPRRWGGYTLPPPPREPVCAECLLIGGSMGGSILDRNNLNVIAGFRARGVGVRLTWISVGRDRGYELDFLANLEWKEGFSHDIYVGMGLVYDNYVIGDRHNIWEGKYRYTVVGYNFNLGGIYLNIGIASGSANALNPKFMVHAGYVLEIL